jgi:transglutaminase-like putative cysteine protease
LNSRETEAATSDRTPAAGEAPAHRVRIDYRVELGYVVAAPADFVFHIHPAHTPQQGVAMEVLELSPPYPATVDFDPVTCNRSLKTHAEAGDFSVRLHAHVDVTHHLVEPSTIRSTRPSRLPTAALRYIAASRYCQADQVQALAWREFGHLRRGYSQVQAVVDWVRERTRFEPGSSGTATSALETLEHGRGVCRDFAHLAIALCRSLNYPARFTTAVDFGADPSLGPPDFHAYVEVFLDRWYIFDPTGISPTTGLIRIATGRDAADVSFATIFGPVRGGMPGIAFDAIVGDGFVRPTHTTLAVSTSVL